MAGIRVKLLRNYKHVSLLLPGVHQPSHITFQLHLLAKPFRPFLSAAGFFLQADILQRLDFFLYVFHQYLFIYGF